MKSGHLQTALVAALPSAVLLTWTLLKCSIFFQSCTHQTCVSPWESSNQAYNLGLPKPQTESLEQLAQCDMI